MCSHYQALKERERYRRVFHVDPPDDWGKLDVWPGYAATFIRRPREADSGDDAVPEREGPGRPVRLDPALGHRCYLWPAHLQRTQRNGQ